MTKLFSYVVVDDTGFAPNPFGNYCTLACCKPDIRKAAEVNDWIVGTGSKKNNESDKIIYAMKVTEKISFARYSEDEEFKDRRDNIYFLDEKKDWKQKWYLFSWEKIPGNDNGKLIEFLIRNFGIEWVKSAQIKRNDDGKTIMVTSETNFLSLTLNEKKTNLNLKIDDGRTDKFIVKTEKDELNIYQKDNKYHYINDMNHDLGGIYVLISDHFYYFGKKAELIPSEFRDETNKSKNIIKKGPNCKCKFNEEFVKNFLKWIEDNFEKMSARKTSRFQ